MGNIRFPQRFQLTERKSLKKTTGVRFGKKIPAVKIRKSPIKSGSNLRDPVFGQRHKRILPPGNFQDVMARLAE